jgi:CubicO group peptidase (beta-lactamase class C family)
MTDTRTSMREAWKEARVARGYLWDEARKELRPLTAETTGLNLDAIAPAGAMSSTVLDMTSWLRFLLRGGAGDGKALISPGALTATWTPQIPIAGNVAYGMGWMVRDWRGQRLIEHGGAVPGFSAEVGLLPDSDLGFVVLTNTLSSLPSIVMALVPRVAAPREQPR